MDIKDFSLNSISFDENAELGHVAKHCNDIGNFFLTPARVLFHGRSVRLISSKDPAMPVLFDSIGDQFSKKFGRLCKNIASIVVVMPASLVGLIIKYIGVLFDHRLEKNYDLLLADEKNDDPNHRANVVLSIALLSKSVENFLDAIKFLDPMVNEQDKNHSFQRVFYGEELPNYGNKFDAWLDSYEKGEYSLPAWPEYPYLSPNEKNFFSSEATVCEQHKKLRTVMAFVFKSCQSGEINNKNFEDILSSLNRRLEHHEESKKLLNSIKLDVLIEENEGIILKLLNMVEIKKDDFKPMDWIKTEWDALD
jgi:hypothetical protein